MMERERERDDKGQMSGKVMQYVYREINEN